MDNSDCDQSANNKSADPCAEDQFPEPVNDHIDFYKSALLHIDDFVSFLDRGYRYRAISRGYLQFFNLKAEDVIGHYAWELHGKERFSTRLKPQLDRSLIDGEEVRFSTEIISPAGEIRHINTRNVPYLNADGAVVGVVINARDETRVWYAEHEFRRLIDDSL